MERIAELAGTRWNPEVVLTFDRGDTHPKTGEPIQEWVRGLPGRYWDSSRKHWVVKSFGENPDRTVREAGFTVNMTPEGLHPSLSDAFGLDELYEPVVMASSERPQIALVRPRLAGWGETKERLPFGARWDKETQRFEVRLIDLVVTADKKRQVLGGLEYLKDTETKALKAALVESPVDDSVASAAAATALSTGLNMTETTSAMVDALVSEVGEIPDWFGLDLYPFQRLGALAAAAGRGLLADSPGLGKTRQALAAAALKDAQRTVIIVPPVVVTHWGREVEESGLPANCNGSVAVFSARRKAPEIPKTGVVVVPDSLLVSRPALVEEIVAWSPDFFIYDEAHRARNWSSARSKMAQELTDRLDDAAKVCISGTPLFAQPHELAPILVMTGHLDPVFGGFSNFLETFSRQNSFKQWVARKRMLPALKQTLDEHVWVRRLKADVLKDLPKKIRQATYVDVDMKGYIAAHNEVADKIAEWLVAFRKESEDGAWPTNAQQEKWARQQIGIISPLRKAAGVSKVPYALDVIGDWVNSNRLSEPAEDGSLYDRPLLIWAHHHEVVTALRAGIAKAAKDVSVSVEVLDGSTSEVNRASIVDRFQAGKVGVLIASITAAGVGITLTRGSDMIFVETDWTPALVSQAEDRQLRIGQTQPVICRTLIAQGTLDERVQKVLLTKAETLNEVMGGTEASVAVAATEDDLQGPADVVLSLMPEAMKRAEKLWKAK